MRFRRAPRCLLAAGLLLLVPVAGQAQTIADSVLMTSTGFVQSNATATAADGSRYFAGGFTGTLTVGATSVTASADADVFVARFDASGALLWLRTMSGATTLPPGFSADGATSLALDDAGGVFVGGGFTDSLYVRDGSGVAATLAEPTAPRASLGAFLVRYDAGGTLVWARGGAGGTRPAGTALNQGGADGVLSLARDGDGGVVVGGAASGTGLFLGAVHPALEDTVATVAIARVDASGTVQWLRTGASTDASNARSVAAGGPRAYVLGDYTATLDLGDGNVLPDGSGDDVFLAALDLATGGVDWVGVISDEGDAHGNSITADAAGAVYLTGSVFSDPELIGYLAKYDADGNFVWIQPFGGLDATEQPIVEGVDVVLGESGEVLLSGRYDHPATFYSDPESRLLDTEPGQFSTFSALLSTGGSLLWHETFSSAGDDVGGGYVRAATQDALLVPLYPVQSAVEPGAEAGTIQLRQVTTFGDEDESGTTTATGVANLELRLPRFATYETLATDTPYALNDGIGGSAVTFQDLGDAQSIAFTVAPGETPENLPNGGLAVARSFRLAAEAPGELMASGFDATVRLCYLEGELGGLDEANLALWRFNGFSGEWERQESTPDPAANCVTATGVSMFSPWAIAPASGSGALPVELTAFTAVRDGATVRLAWTTESEHANAGFGVELRDEAADAPWREMAFVKGAGTTSVRTRYAYPVSGLDAARTYHFRLRQVDTDGAVHYSPEVEAAGNVVLTLGAPYPNPSNGQASVAFILPRAGHVRLVAYDVLGRAVATFAEGDFAAGAHTVHLDGPLAAGVYVLRLEAPARTLTQPLTVLR